jgi:nicotinate-nucleotide pyrophosphorylase (carboxylating)
MSRLVSAVTPGLDADWIRDVVYRTLSEDLGGDPGRDVTSQATIAVSSGAVAHLMARQSGVVAGLVVVQEVLDQVCARFDLAPVAVTFDVADGAKVDAGTRLGVVTGPVQAILIAERSLLNLASRASGVATATRAWADRLAGTNAMVLDTRKTTPGLRALEKYAVRAGGGTNKRMGLYDVAMVKDNHKLAAGGVAAAYARIRTAFPAVPVQVEVTTVAEAVEAVEAGADFLLCDNMSPAVLREVVAAVGDRAELEATGGLTLEVAPAYAATGVDYLSVGALTHSSPILDIALDLRPPHLSRS